MASGSAFLRSGCRLVRSMSAVKSNKPILMSQTKSFSALSASLTPRLGSSCSSLVRMMASNHGDQELGRFILEEISTEKKNQRSLPKLDGWKVESDGAEITLTKDTVGGEKVMVTLNVNHTVDSAQPDDGSEEVRATNCC